MAEDGKIKIDKFDGSDYGFWKMQIEDLLYQKSLHLPMLGEQPDDMYDEEWKLLDRQALGVVRLSLAKSVAYNVVNETTTYGVLKALSNMYEKPSASNKVFLIRQLVNTKMKEGMPVAAHINEFNSIISRLASVEIKFEDEVQALLLLSSLPDSWSGTVTAVSSASGTTKLTFDSIRDLILNEDIRRRSNGESSSSSSLLHTENRGRRNDRGHNRGRSKSRRRGQSKNRKDIECWNCKEKGHFRSQCTKPAAKKEVNSVSSEELGDALICSVEDSVESWIMDSGASFHAISCPDMVKNLRTGNFGKVRLADDQMLDITGIGDVDLKTSLGTIWTLKNVRVIPNLRRKLISVGKLDDEGFNVHFGGGQWKVIKGNLVIAKGKKKGTLYMAEVSAEGVHAMTTGPSPSNLWHNRLGHMSEKGLKMLAQKGKFPDLKKVETEFCEPCVLGKQKRVTFVKTGRTPKAQKLELVHSDVYGPTSVISLGGSRYYVTFIDDSTRKVWVYFLKHKSGVFDAFKIWKSAVENETNLKVKCLKSDNGGEYISKQFTDYCAKEGIKMIKTVPGTPQQNGVAERMNRTLNERARSMRLNAGMPKTFWADAVNTAAYLINRSPSVPLDFKLPEEMWQGNEVSLEHLRVFGCSAYDLLEVGDRDKLDSKSKKCTFIGYGSEEMGYRLWDNEGRKVIRSKNVVFNENELYKDRNTKGPEVQKEYVEFESGEKRKEASVDIPENGDESSDSGSLGDDSSNDSEEEEAAPSTPNSPETPQVQPRRSSRATRPPNRYSPSVNYILLTENGEPQCYSEAMGLKDSLQWELAMKDEMKSLEKNKTWHLIKLPPGKKALQNKWVFRVKDEHDGAKRYKARLVVKGFQQKEGIDFNEIFSPVVKMTTIRLVLSIVAAEGLHLEQLDVKTAFLHGDLEEDIYMTQPEGFRVKGKENLVCKLKKSLCGLKQAPRQWYLKFDNFMGRVGYKRCDNDHCCYIKKFKGSYIILLLYVDDMLIAGSDMSEIKKLKRQMSEEFEMKDLGAANQILGMSIFRNKDGSLTLSQEKYIEKVLEKFKLKDAKIRSTPLGSHFKLSKDQSPKSDEDKEEMAKVPYASAVGSLMYAMVCTRPDIAHAVGVVSRFMSNPGREHWEAVKWLLRYLKGTSKVALNFKGKNVILKGFVDADLGGCKESFKSTTGYVFTVGGTAVSWMSKLQKSVALSTTEAEYMAVAEASKELIWLKNFLNELGKEQDDCALFCDNQSAIHLAKNPVFHSKTKHIQLRYHFIRERINDGTLKLEKIKGTENPADMLTKVVTLEKLKLCIASTGLQYN
ncbi:putative RNA-directed DNA polymerase [Helianthus annuus]|uniref:RNA-directed DNA polymerase n=1 Tax=Helianthus annuus TaxID=4232 RepID=A0A9K3NE64_HELAN|nr:putative RNA-directed DNA polymerase [Helianthus annuus]KAJ0549118.1 putative RNA-directed DNA polymerase [Helianthus annuus]KAJ0562070.1 putative RNA-directed DNA polymerase [Helianthus annuus]KAJ0727449.1 putative RNA-directed DNA polymerase [Helianthus annuus]